MNEAVMKLLKDSPDPEKTRGVGLSKIDYFKPETASINDIPANERFIINMAVAAWGVDPAFIKRITDTKILTIKNKYIEKNNFN